MHSKIHNLTLQGKTGIIFGLISIIYIYINQFLINQFSFDSGITSVLPISIFEIILEGFLVLFVLISYISIVFTNKKRLKKLGVKKWELRAKKIRRIFSIHLILGGIILFLIMNQGFIKYIIPSSLIIYGFAAILINKYTNGNTFILGLIFITVGILTIIVPNFQFHLWAFAFGGLHIVYGVMHPKK